jgi:hypothetical protein
MIVMNVPATKTTLTESLGLRGFSQRGAMNSSRGRRAALFPAWPHRSLAGRFNHRRSCWLNRLRELSLG